MSKADITEFVEAVSDEEIKKMAGVGASLREFGKHLEDQF